jgi:hypothetical protein
MKSSLMKLSIILLLLFVSADVIAQEKGPAAKADYSKEPVWIKMIDDPRVNYYEAIEAFETYWKGKVKPEEEEELIAEGKITEKEAERMKKERASWTPAQLNEYQMLKYHVKRFDQWKRDVFPYVQSDGRILTEQERMDIYNKQKNSR